MTSSNIGALTTTFTPASDCATTFFAENVLTSWLQYDAATSCLPASFDRNYTAYYSPGVCPSGYWYAEVESAATTTGTGTEVESTATCCPNGYTRVPDRTAGDINACRSTYLSSYEFKVDMTSFGSVATSIGRPLVTVVSGDFVAARGPIIRRAGSDAAWVTSTGTGTTGVADSTTTSTGGLASSTSTSSGGARNGSGSESASGSGSGLSTGAQAGIGIGVAAGVLGIAAMLFMAYRLGRKARAQKGREEAEAEKAAASTAPSSGGGGGGGDASGQAQTAGVSSSPGGTNPAAGYYDPTQQQQYHQGYQYQYVNNGAYAPQAAAYPPHYAAAEVDGASKSPVMIDSPERPCEADEGVQRPELGT